MLTTSQEARDRSINLPEDDPQTLRCMLSYLYTADYDDGQSAAVTMSTSHEENAINTSKASDEGAGESRSMGSTLLNNALVYALAEKYDVEPLKELSKSKFQIQTWGKDWNFDDIPRLLQEVHRSIPATDRGLRDIVIELCAQHIDRLMSNPVFSQVLHEDAILAIEILVWSEMPK